MEELAYFTLGLDLLDEITKDYSFIVNNKYTPAHIRDTVSRIAGFTPALLVLDISFRRPILALSEVRFEHVEGRFVDNQHLFSIERRNKLNNANFKNVIVQLIPTQPVKSRGLGPKRKREEGGDRGRGDRGRGGIRERWRGRL